MCRSIVDSTPITPAMLLLQCSVMLNPQLLQQLLCNPSKAKGCYMPLLTIDCAAWPTFSSVEFFGRLMAGENKTLVLGRVLVPKLRSLAVERTRAV